MQTPPTPWTMRLDPNGETYSILDADGFPQAFRVSPEAADAILAAVNGRERMREALVEARAYFRDEEGSFLDDEDLPWFYRAALADTGA